MTEQARSLEMYQAKQQLQAIDVALISDALLIGGLAVQHYEFSRVTKDIDLLVDLDTARSLIAVLYSNEDWDVIDHNNDELRPRITAVHKYKHGILPVNFGPKILERPHYQYLPWSVLWHESKPYTFRQAPMHHIRVPCVEAVAVSKIVSFLGRSEAHEAKIAQDLKDLSALTNHREFRLSTFYNMLRECEAIEVIRDRFWQRAHRYKDFATSYLWHISELFGDKSRTSTTILAGANVDAIPLGAPSASANQEDHFQKFEQAATDVRAFSLCTLFGPLQDLDYATLVLATYGTREPRAGARARMRRQTALLETGRSVRVVVHPWACDHRIWNQDVLDDAGHVLIPREVVPKTIRSLAKLLSNGSCQIATLTEDSRSGVPLQSDYVIYDQSVVYVETLNIGIVLRDRAAVAAYLTHFDRAWNSSVYDMDALQILRDRAGEFGLRHP